jgi:hypothetical protein
VTDLTEDQIETILSIQKSLQAEYKRFGLDANNIKNPLMKRVMKKLCPTWEDSKKYGVGILKYIGSLYPDDHSNVILNIKSGGKR